MNKPIVNRINDIKLIDCKSKVKPFSPHIASMNIVKPADAMSATTAGRNPFNTPLMIDSSLYR